MVTGKLDTSVPEWAQYITLHRTQGVHTILSVDAVQLVRLPTLLVPLPSPMFSNKLDPHAVFTAAELEFYVRLGRASQDEHVCAIPEVA